MDQQTLNMPLFGVTAAAVMVFTVWQIRRAKKR